MLCSASSIQGIQMFTDSSEVVMITWGIIIQRAASFVLKAGEYGEVCDF